MGRIVINVMLSVSRLAARSASTSLLFRSYGKIRELAATVPGKKPIVCTPEEVVECVKSDDKVFFVRFMIIQRCGFILVPVLL